MPKPTTHTDIVVVTNEDPIFGGLGSESIQLTLAGEGRLLAVFGVENDIDVGPSALLTGPPVGVRFDAGGPTVELAYEARLQHNGQLARLGRQALLSRPKETLSSTSPTPLPLLWKAPASPALITEFELTVHATLDGQPLRSKIEKSSTGTTQSLQLTFNDGTKVFGHLTMTAVMDALPTF